MTDPLKQLRERMDRFDAGERQAALKEAQACLNAGTLKPAESSGWVNTHLHTFHSFNAEGYSPTRVVFEARVRGLEVVGSVDFDVLDAMEEMFLAGDALDMRTVASLESRVFVQDYAEVELNSPGEPGVNYFMGAGFTRLPEPGSPAARTLDAMRAGARARNEAMLERLRPALTPLGIDYERDVLPLTPGGNATERHMLAAFDARAREEYPGADALAGYWAERLGMRAEEVNALLPDTAAFRNAVRKKLMKRGGPGYQQPDASTFPPLMEVTEMIRACGAIPCATWLDGTTPGESDAATWLDYFVDRGCLALNIIPDRNWNISDAETRELKVRKFKEIVEEARARNLIFSVGTEMNNYGLPFVDNFDADVMAPMLGSFRDGALILYGHTLLERAAGLGRMSDWATTHFGSDRKAANGFYLKVGVGGFPPRAALDALKGVDENATPEDVLQRLKTLE